MKTLHPWKFEENARLGASTGYKSKTGSIAAGIRYHRGVYEQLRKFCKTNLPGHKLYIEPWFRNKVTQSLRSPDAVLVDPALNTAIVIEVKMNWKDGRDKKLLDEYLPIVQSAFALDTTWPLLITGNVRGIPRGTFPLLGLKQIEDCLTWFPGQATPIMLVLK